MNSDSISLYEILKTNKYIGKFWIKVQNKYPSLNKEALKALIPFATTCLCANGFSTIGNYNKT